MAKPKSKLLANRSPHAVTLSNEGVATRRNNASKVKKADVDAAPEPTPLPIVSRSARSVRRPIDPPELVAEAPQVLESVAATPLVAQRGAPSRKPKARSSAPKGPSLSAAMQERMRAMATQIESLKATLADVERKQRGVGARRTVV